MVQLQDCWVFQKKDKGLARRLRGKVLVELVFAENSTTKWLPYEMDRFYAVYKEAEEALCKQASAAGVPLSFTVVREHLIYQETKKGGFNSRSTDEICKQYVQKKGYKSCTDYGQHRKRSAGADEICLILVLEQKIRAFAVHGSGLEYCVVYEDDKACVVIHELLHLFGAADLYYPYFVQGLTLMKYPGSAMCTYDGMEVDPLTQHLIGWQEVAPFRVREFLCKIADCTVERHNYANTLEWYRTMDEKDVLAEAKPYANMGTLRTKSEKGDPWAQFLLGLCCRDGIGTGKNTAQAEEYFMQSGRGGLVIGAFAHAQMLLYRGAATERDRENLELLLNYHDWAHLRLNALQIVSYYNGTGVEKKRDWAISKALLQHANAGWYQERGQYSARLYRFAQKLTSNLPELHAAVSKMQRDYQQILKDGDPDLQFFVARLKENGEGTEKDPAGALTLYRSAAQNGNFRACYALCRCYQEGIGTKNDPAAAEHWRLRGTACRKENRWDIFCRLM